MSKSDRINVSREVLTTMLEAVMQCRLELLKPPPTDAFEHGQQLAGLSTKLMDVSIALEDLCSRQS